MNSRVVSPLPLASQQCLAPSERRMIVMPRGKGPKGGLGWTNLKKGKKIKLKFDPSPRPSKKVNVHGDGKPNQNRPLAASRAKEGLGRRRHPKARNQGFMPWLRATDSDFYYICIMKRAILIKTSNMPIIAHFFACASISPRSSVSRTIS